LKALVLEEYNHFVYKDVPEPVLRADDVMVKIKACGICGSDVHGMDGTTGRRIPPVIMGHEASGIIVEVGSNVTNIKQGERVTFDSTVYCGTCFYCRKGDINLCDHRRVLGVSCDEYIQNGAFAEYVAVPQHIIYPLPEKIGFTQSAMVEPCSVAYHAVARASGSTKDTAVVVGVGIIGLLVVQILQAEKWRQIIAVDIEPDKLSLACRLGAQIGLNPKQEDVVSNVKNMTEGRGADAAFDAVGLDVSLKTAIDSLRKGAVLTLIGNLASHVDLPLQNAVTGEITINGSCASRGEYPACLDLIAAGIVNVDSLISAVAPLAEGDSWFRRLYQKEKGLLKIILEP
jgi:threonine dehydrogenase-like Zn-dependent dehydrogenase